MIPVGWLAPSADCWDTHMLRLLLDGDLYPHGLKVRHCAGYPNTDAPVVIVVPGRYYAQHTEQINEAISRFASVLMVVTSDEEATFDIGRISHPQHRFWVQTPRQGRDYGDARLFGVGYPPHFSELQSGYPEKSADVFLAAQATHARRTEAFNALAGSNHTVDLYPTKGFTQGLEPAEYVSRMVGAKMAPCPSGAVSVDSFRFWEALDSHAVPIVDTVSPVDGETNYWERLFADSWPVPFPVYQNATELPALITQTLSDWPAIGNRTAAWWMRYKRELAIWLVGDLTKLGAI